MLIDISIICRPGVYPGYDDGPAVGRGGPFVAAEYQMAILWLIFVTAGVCTFVGLYLATIRAVSDSNHRLTPEKIIKTAGSKVTIDVALVRMITETAVGVYKSAADVIAYFSRPG